MAYLGREASSLAEAIASAARDIDKVPGLRAVGVQCDNMVIMLDIAKRAGVSREAVRLWARDALRSEPDDTVRREFERLLEDA